MEDVLRGLPACGCPPLSYASLARDVPRLREEARLLAEAAKKLGAGGLPPPPSVPWHEVYATIMALSNDCRVCYESAMVSAALGVIAHGSKKPQTKGGASQDASKAAAVEAPAAAPEPAAVSGGGGPELTLKWAASGKMAPPPKKQEDKAQALAGSLAHAQGFLDCFVVREEAERDPKLFVGTRAGLLRRAAELPKGSNLQVSVSLPELADASKLVGIAEAMGSELPEGEACQKAAAPVDATTDDPVAAAKKRLFLAALVVLLPLHSTATAKFLEMLDVVDADDAKAAKKKKEKEAKAAEAAKKKAAAEAAEAALLQRATEESEAAAAVAAVAAASDASSSEEASPASTTTPPADAGPSSPPSPPLVLAPAPPPARPTEEDDEELRLALELSAKESREAAERLASLDDAPLRDDELAWLDKTRYAPGAAAALADGSAAGLDEDVVIPEEEEEGEQFWTEVAPKPGAKNGAKGVKGVGAAGGDMPAAMRGLGNRYGENNCFLNVVVQSLYRCGDFKTLLRDRWGSVYQGVRLKLTTDAEKAAYSVVGTLVTVFDALDALPGQGKAAPASNGAAGAGESVSLNSLRRAMGAALVERELERRRGIAAAAAAAAATAAASAAAVAPTSPTADASAKAAPVSAQSAAAAAAATVSLTDVSAALRSRAMADASEALDEVLTVVHESEATLSRVAGKGGVIEAPLMLPASPSGLTSAALGGFGMLIREAVVCTRCKTPAEDTQPQVSTVLAQFINTHDLMAQAGSAGGSAGGGSSGGGVKKTTPFGTVLRAVTEGSESHRACTKCAKAAAAADPVAAALGGAGAATRRPLMLERTLLRMPKTLSYVLGWASPREPIQFLRGVLEALDPVINLRQAMKSEGTPGATASGSLPARLRGLICYVDSHWVAFFDTSVFGPAAPGVPLKASWVCANDERVFPVDSPAVECLAHHLQPSILLYEVGRAGEPIPVDRGRGLLWGTGGVDGRAPAPSSSLKLSWEKGGAASAAGTSGKSSGAVVGVTSSGPEFSFTDDSLFPSLGGGKMPALPSPAVPAATAAAGVASAAGSEGANGVSPSSDAVASVSPTAAAAAAGGAPKPSFKALAAKPAAPAPAPAPKPAAPPAPAPAPAPADAGGKHKHGQRPGGGGGGGGGGSRPAASPAKAAPAPAAPGASPAKTAPVPSPAKAAPAPAAPAVSPGQTVIAPPARAFPPAPASSPAKPAGGQRQQQQQPKGQATAPGSGGASGGVARR